MKVKPTQPVLHFGSSGEYLIQIEPSASNSDLVER